MDQVVENMYTQLCLWPSTSIGDSTSKEFEEYMLDTFGVRIKFKCIEITLPDKDEFDCPVPETGGRSDLFFYVNSEDIPRFAVPRLKVGIRWWEDVLRNGGAYLYSKQFLTENPSTW
jgi:hypothetical protein